MGVWTTGKQQNGNAVDVSTGTIVQLLKDVDATKEGEIVKTEVNDRDKALKFDLNGNTLTGKIFLAKAGDTDSWLMDSSFKGAGKVNGTVDLPAVNYKIDGKGKTTTDEEDQIHKDSASITNCKNGNWVPVQDKDGNYHVYNAQWVGSYDKVDRQYLFYYRYREDETKDNNGVMMKDKHDPLIEDGKTVTPLYYLGKALSELTSTDDNNSEFTMRGHLYGEQGGKPVSWTYLNSSGAMKDGSRDDTTLNGTEGYALYKMKDSYVRAYGEALKKNEEDSKNPIPYFIIRASKAEGKTDWNKLWCRGSMTEKNTTSYYAAVNKKAVK